jgi:FMN-dependent NADH-azoreductase
MKLLHIDASVLGDNSVSRQLAAAVVARLRQVQPQLSVTYRDLAAAPLPHMVLTNLPTTHPIAASLGALAEQADVRAAMGVSQDALDEFLAADVVVIGAPMYNFTISSQLKAWIDRIVVNGKTFQYGANGPQGLAGAKRVIIAVSRGGMYGPESPAAAAEHVESYLRTVFGFIGVTNLQVIVAEGVQMGPEHRTTAVDGALHAIAALQ